MSTPLQPTGHGKNDDGDSDGSSGTTDAFLDGGHEHHDEESD